MLIYCKKNYLNQYNILFIQQMLVKIKSINPYDLRWVVLVALITVSH
jgi:hypothetical protein